MSETTQAEKRIAAVAKELNVGVAHLIEHLNKKGFKVENKPTTKITMDMYGVLLQEFSQDKTYKQQAEKITIGRTPPPAAAAPAAPPSRSPEPAQVFRRGTARCGR